MADSPGLFDGRPLNESLYKYAPSRPAAVIFVVLFSISTVIHMVQAVRYRTWFMIFTAGLCGIAEVVGWAGRLRSSFDPFIRMPYIIQSSCLVIAPTPLLAASFVVFGRIITHLGPAYSRLSPKWYTIVFCSFDVFSILTQGAGGGIAASAETPEASQRGSNILLGGIGLQLVVIVIFAICVAEYFIRYMISAPLYKRLRTQDGPSATGNDAIRGEFTPRLKFMTYALVFMTTVLFIRAVYRFVELIDGWDGPLRSNELLFNVLDGAMIVLAIYTFNVARPGVLLRPSRSPSRASESYPMVDA